jgi:hypothetical protein
MSRVVSLLLIVGAVIGLSTASVSAEVDLAGEWLVTFTGPTGPAEYTMFVAQEGTRVTGRMTSASGEFPLRGSIDGEQFRIVWALPDQGRMLEIVFTGTVDGDTLAGKALLGKSGEGPVHGERVGR